MSASGASKMGSEEGEETSIVVWGGLRLLRSTFDWVLLVRSGGACWPGSDGLSHYAQDAVLLKTESTTLHFHINRLVWGAYAWQQT